MGCYASKIKLCDDIECKKTLSEEHVLAASSTHVLAASSTSLVDPMTGLIEEVLVVVDQSEVFTKDIFVRGYTYGEKLHETLKI
mgnify:CR=1 FL=1